MAEPLGGNYWRLWSASAISNLGDGVTVAALPLLAATLTRDPAAFAGVALAGRLPWILFALLAGAIVDRLDRRRLMAAVQVVRFGVLLLLALAAATDRATLPILYATAFILGIAETLFDNAAQTLMPRLVPRTELERANGRLYAVEITANEFMGPPVGALLFAIAVGLPFLLDAATFAAASVLILAIGGVHRVESIAPRTSVRSEIAEGLRWLWRHRLLRALALMLGALNLIGTATMATFLLFALEVLGVNEIGFGALLSSTAVGSVVGGLIGGRLTGRFGAGPLLLAVIVLQVAVYSLIGITSNPIVVGGMFVIYGFTAIVWNVITVSLRQAIIPDRLLGRVNSVYRFFGWGAMPIGAAIGGLLAEAFGLRAPWFFAAATAFLLLTAVPSIRTRTINEARSAAEAERS
ncbi:MAG: MFS transporter [Actinomycetota bacterium]